MDRKRVCWIAKWLVFMGLANSLLAWMGNLSSGLPEEAVQIGFTTGGTQAAALESLRPPAEEIGISTLPASRPDAAAEIGAKPGKETPVMALTFDDGPHKENTGRILDALEQYGAKATFFIVGNRIAGREAVIARMEDLGMEIGNHTFDHVNLKKISLDEVEQQIEMTNQALYPLLGHGAELVRPPYGTVGKAAAQRIPYPLIHWTVDTEDWKTREQQAVYQAVMEAAKQDFSLVLLHDFYDTTAQALERAIPELVQKGVRLVTVSEFYQAKGVNLEPGKLYRG